MKSNTTKKSKNGSDEFGCVLLEILFKFCGDEYPHDWQERRLPMCGGVKNVDSFVRRTFQKEWPKQAFPIKYIILTGNKSLHNIKDNGEP